MYKVFLVEDEIVIREGIKSKIRWEEEGFQIVGDESDGELAYPMILRTQPDILITDIKMPFMDGLELSKLLRKNIPNLKIIIISGYSDFSYAQQAIDIGICEYLLKPITSGKLLDSVKNAAATIEKDRKEKQILEQYQQLVYQKQGEKRKEFFEALVSGNLSLAEIIKREEELGIAMRASVFCVMLFQFIEKNDAYSYSTEIVQYEAAMTTALATLHDLVVFERGVDGWAFILLGENDASVQELSQKLRDLLIHVCDNKAHFFGGIGRCVHRVRDIQQSYLDANRAYALRYFQKGDQFVSYLDVQDIREQIGNEVNLSDMNLEKHDRNLLQDFLRRGTLHDVDEFVESYLNGYGASAMNSALFRNFIILDGCSAIISFMTSFHFPKDMMDTCLKNMNNVADQLASLESCKNFLASTLKDVIEKRNTNSYKRYALLIEQAKQYMHKSLGRVDLSLDKVAATVNVSPNYFSSLFNQETGMTFIEYLTNIRMEKAKEYLRCSGKKITEIGTLVGYQDSHYFSYIFKKTQNCTPSDYRVQGKCEE